MRQFSFCYIQCLRSGTLLGILYWLQLQLPLNNFYWLRLPILFFTGSCSPYFFYRLQLPVKSLGSQLPESWLRFSTLVILLKVIFPLQASISFKIITCLNTINIKNKVTKKQLISNILRMYLALLEPSVLEQAQEL